MKISDIDLTFLDTYLSEQENIYFYFINNPNLPLAYVYKANNTLRKYVTDYVGVLQKMYDSLQYINNTEKESNSDTNVQLQIFLSKGANNNLKNSLFEYLHSFQTYKSGDSSVADNTVDVLENIYSGFSLLNQLYPLIVELQRNIGTFNPIFDFSFIKEDLLNKLSSTVSTNDAVKKEQSSVSTLINVLSSYSYLTGLDTSISAYSPLFSATITKEKTNAVAISGPTTTVSSTDFKVTVDTNTYIIPFPSSAAQGKKYIRANTGTVTFSTKKRLYFQVTCPVLPKGYTLLEGVTIPDGVIAVDIPAGTYTTASLLPVINTGLNTLDTLGNPFQFGLCSYFSSDVDKFLVYGDASLTSMSLIPAPGQYNHLTGVFTSAVESCHSELGMLFGPAKNPYEVDYQDLRDCVSYFTPISIVENLLQVSSINTGETAKVLFSPSISTEIGFTDTYATDTILTLSEGETLVTLNSIVVDSTGEHTVTNVSPLVYSNTPNKDSYPVTVFSDLVSIVKELTKVSFTIPQEEIIRLWGPLLNSPTVAQINEAKSKTKDIITGLSNYASSLTFVAQNSSVLKASTELTTYLEQKGYNRLIDFLIKADFTNFFAATKENTKMSYNQSLAETISNG
jgi:hypothetical protein